MKIKSVTLMSVVVLLAACTNTEKLTYLNNLPESEDPQYFPMDLPDYRIQYRDILYITVKAMNSEGSVDDLLLGSRTVNQSAYLNSESSQFIVGYTVEMDGTILLPVVGKIYVNNNTISEVRELIQEKVDIFFNNAFVEVKLLSFKFTVLGEARSPGSYINYNNYLTVFEAVGRAGGVGDFGRRDRVLVVRPTEEGTKTFIINLQDKNLLTSEAYFLQPNDVVIIEPVKHKVFNMNLPTFSFIVVSVTSTITTLLLLLNYFETN